MIKKNITRNMTAIRKMRDYCKKIIEKSSTSEPWTVKTPEGLQVSTTKCLDIWFSVFVYLLFICFQKHSEQPSYGISLGVNYQMNGSRKCSV